MKISGQLTWRDYLESQFLHIKPNRLLRRVWFVLIVLAVLSYGAGMYVMIVDNLGPIWPYLWPALIVAGALLLYLLYLYVFLPRKVRQIYQQHMDMSAPFEIEITPTGLVSSNQYGYANRPWRKFRKWKESKDLLMLYLSDIQFLLIPKRFITDEQMEAIRARLGENNVREASAS